MFARATLEVVGLANVLTAGALAAQNVTTIGHTPRVGLEPTTSRLIPARRDSLYQLSNSSRIHRADFMALICLSRPIASERVVCCSDQTNLHGPFLSVYMVRGPSVE